MYSLRSNHVRYAQYKVQNIFFPPISNAGVKVSRNHCSVSLVNHGLSNLTLPALCSLETVRVSLVVVEGLDDLVLGGEDEGAVLDDGLVEGSSGD